MRSEQRKSPVTEKKQATATPTGSDRRMDQWGPAGHAIWAEFHRMHPVRIARTLLLTLALLATGIVVQPANAISRDQTATALRSTVQVIVPDNDFEIFSLGSGTIMNATGLVLTNNHVVEGDAGDNLMNDEALAFIAVPPADLPRGSRDQVLWLYRQA